MVTNATNAEKAFANAIKKELENDQLFLEKCKYHEKLMEELFHSKGLTDHDTPEAIAIFEEVKKRMEKKFGK
tara:strand:- start:229 stop:444 length:216 start_codon:yes stop_codon:yes gene_type:complete